MARSCVVRASCANAAFRQVRVACETHTGVPLQESRRGSKKGLMYWVRLRFPEGLRSASARSMAAEQHAVTRVRAWPDMLRRALMPDGPIMWLRLLAICPAPSASRPEIASCAMRLTYLEKI
eukprot:scaffold3139_cov110-Isochrysis_galbana.AAC.11